MITVAFDVDGCLLRAETGEETPGDPGCPLDHAAGPFRYCACGWTEAQTRYSPNEMVRSQLLGLWKWGCRIHVWSGGGELWARQAAALAGVERYVDSYSHKLVAGEGFVPDITFDDEEITLGTVNIRVS